RQGSSCPTFAQLATPSGTTFSDSGLTASTTYRYRVRAADAAGNLSTYSATVSGTTGAAADTSAPTSPSGLTATADGSSAVNLAWSASTDNVGVEHYRVERCQGSSSCTNFSPIATSPQTSYRNEGLTASTTYRYRIRAVDAAGNVSGASNRVAVTTASAADTTPPGAPSSLAATANGSTTIDLSWPAASDNVGVTGYRLERCQGAGCTSYSQIATPTGTSFSNSGLATGATYSYRVRAVDAAGNLGAYSPVASATTSAAAPVASFTATPVSGTAPLAVSFTSTSTGSIASYAWTFGDGTSSTAQNPAKTYSTSGSFTVSLTVTGPGGSHTATQTGYVNVSSAPATLQNVGLMVDAAAVTGTSSNANGILEPGETVLVAPIWAMTDGSAAVTVSASATVSGPGSSAFGLADGHASYGTIALGAIVDCQSATGNCYRLAVSPDVKRPTLKWGIDFTETLSTGATVTRNIPIGRSFADVASGDMFYPMIESLLWNDVTTGYPDGTFQPSLGITRWQTAIFVARGAAGRGGDVNLPSSGTVNGLPFNCASGGTSRFTDVPATDAACRHVHYLASRLVNVAFGCGSGTSACPTAATSRAAMAVLIAGAIAQGGDAGVPMTGTFTDTGTARSYNCAVTGGGRFSDVPSSASYCRHANYLWARGIVDGYADGTFQPNVALTRGQMAKFVAQAFRLRLD
ncbi:MAG: S-layer homology domain-containing protein, partial [Burkholderiales bacterium]|nr:S-layer homology domain-containing protein [Burkholderiales bacterium]